MFPLTNTAVALQTIRMLNALQTIRMLNVLAVKEIEMSMTKVSQISKWPRQELGPTQRTTHHNFPNLWYQHVLHNQQPVLVQVYLTRIWTDQEFLSLQALGVCSTVSRVIGLGCPFVANLAVYWKPLPMLLLGTPTLLVAGIMTRCVLLIL